MKKTLILFLLLVFSCSKDDPPSFLISIDSQIGGTVSSSGGEYAQGKSITVTATPDGEYEFVNWSNGSTQNPLTITVSSNQVITANFQKKKYALLVSTSGKGTVIEELISSGRGNTYNSGSVVKLTATPQEGYSFSGWTGDLVSSENPVEIDINSPKQITANFEQIMISLEVNIEGEGEVLQELVAAGKSTDYTYGSIVRLTPEPAEGFDFISWSEDHTGEENPLELTLTEPITLQANFDYELFNRVVGKWKIRKKDGDDKINSYMHSITFRKNYSFTVNTSLGQVDGTFDVLSNTEMELLDFGTISGIDLTEDESEPGTGNGFNFNIDVPGQFEGGEECDQDVNYISEVSESGEIIEKTYLPDDNFEQALIDLGYDDTLDNYVNTSNIIQVATLPISGKGISNLDG
ncbi:MAG: hypothetical protein CMC79_01375, partial [Flavobacteriaceae bacterium]|nr:hypothetical protein [Flavobacteriaceae bacterium]